MNKDSKQIKNPNAMLVMHGIVILLVLYLFWQLLRDYLRGGEGAPSLTVLIVGGVLLIGGCGLVAYLALRLYRQAKAQALEEALLLQQERERLAAQEELTEADGADAED